MFPRNTISLALAGMIFLQSFSFSDAQSVNNSDKEYDTQVQEDMQGVSDNEGFSRIEKSVDKSLLDTSDAKLARKTAKDYIDSIKNSDTHWKGNNPKLIGKPVPYYTDDTSMPISYEWKVKCSNMNDCGSIMVAVADNIARVMEAGTYGTANYERLGTGKESRKNKLYYYSAFDQYIESSSGSDITVGALDPGIELKKSNSERKDELKSRKDSVKSMRKGGKLSFQEVDALLTTSTAMTGNSSSVTTSSLVVTAAATVTTVNVPSMTPTANCSSAVPCYSQFSWTYGSNTCLVGCAPLAMTQIFGYYDRRNKFPNLIGNSSVFASDWNSLDSLTRDMANTIRGYTNSVDGSYYAGSASFLFPKIQNEINAGRPLMVNYTGSPNAHSMAAYGYISTGNIGTSQIHVNFGQGTYYPDKYIPINFVIGADLGDPHNGVNVIVGTNLTSIVTVLIK